MSSRPQTRSIEPGRRRSSAAIVAVAAALASALASLSVPARAEVPGSDGVPRPIAVPRPAHLAAAAPEAGPTLVEARDTPPQTSGPMLTAQAQTQPRTGSVRGAFANRAGIPIGDGKVKERINQWTIGLAAGRVEGAPLRLAAELAQVLDDGDNLRVMPIVTRGPFDNFNDLLFLRGIDLAIVYGDTLDHFKTKEKVPNVENRITYIANLFPAEVHVLARPEINTLKDLDGKVVNFNTAGTAAAFTGPIVFERLGIKVVARFDPHRDALEKMKAGDGVAATFWVTSKPITPLANPAWPAGFKLLPVDYTKELEEYYLPATLEHQDYPKLIPQGQKVQTVAVPTVLAAYNWSTDTDRARRISRMIDQLFERWPQLHKPPNDPKWKDVNLAAAVPGWKRYPAMQTKLEALTPKPAAMTGAGAQAAGIDPALAREQARRAAPNSRAEQERLFQQFLEWSRARNKTQ